jgi:ribosomal protein S18 acetylase RimI-like enzyme
MADTVTIRTLDPHDLPLILSVPDEVFDAPVRPDEARAFLSDPGHDIVAALTEAGIVGFASGAVLRHPDKAPAYFIAEVGTHPAFQRRGIARRMVAALIDRARLRGCEGIWLATETDNGPARALYRSLGARETDGIVVCDWDGAMDDV